MRGSKSKKPNKSSDVLYRQYFEYNKVQGTNQYNSFELCLTFDTGKSTSATDGYRPWSTIEGSGPDEF
jgi:hypothetical protein